MKRQADFVDEYIEELGIGIEFQSWNLYVWLRDRNQYDLAFRSSQMLQAHRLANMKPNRPTKYILERYGWGQNATWFAMTSNDVLRSSARAALEAVNRIHMDHKLRAEQAVKRGNDDDAAIWEIQAIRYESAMILLEHAAKSIGAAK